MIRLVALAALLVVASPAWAQFPACSAEMSQPEINDCSHREYVKTDARLNRLYVQLKNKLTDPKTQQALVAAEKAWIAYRDSQCDFETIGSIGGSIRPLELAECLNNKTLAHIAELQRQLDCPEGDLTCAH
jgi:uncharacterized protein YecT (DUF1311 family)